MPSVADKPATLFVGLELTKSTWLVAIYLPQHRLARRSSNVAQQNPPKDQVCARAKSRASRPAKSGNSLGRFAERREAGGVIRAGEIVKKGLDFGGGETERQ